MPHHTCDDQVREDVEASRIHARSARGEPCTSAKEGGRGCGEAWGGVGAAIQGDLQEQGFRPVLLPDSTQEKVGCTGKGI